MRCIDADAFDKCLEDAEDEAIHMQKYVFASALNTIRGNLRAFPTIDPERKTGKWIEYLEPGCENCHCDVCGTQWYPEDLYLGGNDFPKYCPECGAQMENWKTGYGEEGDNA